MFIVHLENVYDIIQTEIGLSVYQTNHKSCPSSGWIWQHKSSSDWISNCQIWYSPNFHQMCKLDICKLPMPNCLVTACFGVSQVKFNYFEDFSLFQAVRTYYVQQCTMSWLPRACWNLASILSLAILNFHLFHSKDAICSLLDRFSWNVLQLLVSCSNTQSSSIAQLPTILLVSSKVGLYLTWM